MIKKTLILFIYFRIYISQKTYLTILKGGIYLSLLSVFWVSSKLLFPYITSKQIYFNVLIELLFVFWLAFLVKFPEYRPKRSWISTGLVVYFAVILLSCFFSVDFNLSFWGDVERMLGFFHILHFLVFYFIVITVFRRRDDWRNLMMASLAAALIVALYSFKITFSTIGNSAYVAGYLIFNIYFALILFFRTKNWALRSAYAIAAFFMLVSVKNTDVAGAYVGLGVSVILSLLLYGVLSRGRRVKIASLSLFVAAVALAASLFAFRGSSFVQGNDFLSKVTQELSVGKNTFQTRLISWRAAWLDFPEHPLLGAGYGNFAISFDKYFDPLFYNYTRSETYFDRAHNNLIDIASTTGVAGLAAYLSIFAAVGYYLVGGYRRKRIALIDFVLLSGLTAAYFIQNLAVFDSLVTYMSLMVALGLVHWLSVEGTVAPLEREGMAAAGNRKESYALAVAGVIALVIIYQYNVKPLKMLTGVIDGQRIFAQERDIAKTMDAYARALSYDTVLDRDGRNSFAQLVAQNPGALKSVGKGKASEILDYAIGLAERNVQYNPSDSLAQTMLSQILGQAAEFHRDDKEKFYFYITAAEEAINRSIEASPGRIPLYFHKARIYTARGEIGRAVEILEYAVSLNNDYYESVCQLAKIRITHDQEGGYDDMNACIDRGGVNTLFSSGFVVRLINHYAERGDNRRVLKLYERLAALDSKNAKVFINLANLYVAAGDKEKAIETARKVSDLDPGLKDDVDSFIRGLEE